MYIYIHELNNTLLKVEKITPELNKVYLIKNHTLIHILSGIGQIQVDFKNYDNWQDKAIFLEKGQYIKYLSPNFTIRKIEFLNSDKFYNSDVRVLFKHLIALGYIDLMECSDCQSFLSETVLTNQSAHIIDISTKQWYWQNPFDANQEEYQIIFDTKDVIDSQYHNHLTNADLTDLIRSKGYHAQTLVKNKIGLSIKHLLGKKRLTESQKTIAFTDKSIQEVAYDLGYKDVAYFNRVFKQSTGQNPTQFREQFNNNHKAVFSTYILELIKTHHTEQRTLDFYANQVNLSVKSLSKKVQTHLQTSIGQLIRQEIINTAKHRLTEGETIHSIALLLNFEEPNHFSTFFKHYSGMTPTEFKLKKYKP